MRRSSERSDRPSIEVPNPAQDRPVWTRVGIIASVGFLVGMAWPKIAGVQLAPTPPGQEAKASAAASSALVVAPPLPVSASASVKRPPEPVKVQTVVVKKTDVLSCRDERNRAVESCDRPDLDTMLIPRLKQLANCPSGAGLEGKLSIGFDVDFRRDRIEILHGKSTTIPGSTVTGIWRCAHEGIKGLDLKQVAHQHSRYTIYYAAWFYPPGRVVEGSDDVPTDAEQKPGTPSKERAIGFAQVVYDTVLVREKPKTGKVIARLVRGTRVELLEKEGSWYRIRFEEREGWVYRGSIAQ